MTVGKDKFWSDKTLQSKPLIRWAGSKRKLLPVLLKNIPDHFERYVEPFCGSACLFFELPPRKAFLSDINAELINALKVIKSDKSIRDELIKLPATEEEYYKIRSLDPGGMCTKDKAIRFLYLNRFCFNGVYRTNMSGNFNVPRGTRTGSFPIQSVFDSAREKLAKANLTVSDYKKTLGKLKQGDFVYMDPPYSKSTKFTGEYGVGSFNGGNLDDLYEQLHKLDECGVKFLLSYRACDRTIKELSSKFIVTDLSVKRHISGFKSSWQEAKEILVKNYEK